MAYSVQTKTNASETLRPAPEHAVDLRSDTITRPTPGMREAMAHAPVGDDVFGEDPTVNAFEARIAELLGKEAAVFVPSGTMANLIAILSQTRPGESVILGAHAHPYKYEAGNIAVVGGLMTKTINAECGLMDADAVAAQIVRTDDPHASCTSLVAIENTTNFGGGNIYAPERVRMIAEVAHERGLRVHCDGARLFNAVVATGISARDLVAPCESVSVCFSKGLGCPVGSITAGSCETIAAARKWRKRLGGGMRQAGVLAAAANYALEHHVGRLADDHARARRFREALEALPGVSFPMPTPTNIVFFDVADAPSVQARLRETGVLTLAVSAARIRAVFHLDIDDDAVERAIEMCKAVMK
jgi:threonine aldolase